MKIIQQILISIFIVIFLGCATTTQNIPKPQSEILQNGKARIILHRRNEAQGSIITYKIYDNGKLVGKLGHDKPLVWDRPIGVIKLSRDWNYAYSGKTANNSITISAQDGYLYELYVGHFAGFTSSSGKETKEDVSQSWIGSHYSELIRQWGAYTRTIDDGVGGKILIWERRYTESSTTTPVELFGQTVYSHSGASSGVSYRDVFIDKNGHITNIKWGSR